MNIPAALIATTLGVAFFAAELSFDSSFSFVNRNSDFVLSILSPNHSKARKAVLRLLISPASAEFDALRSVDAGTAKYVCGAVKAKDKWGYDVGYRDFVYTVATDSARIDDDGLIAQKYGAFTSCQALQEQKPAPEKLLISPDALAMVKNIQKIMPPADSSALSTIASQLGAGGAGSSSGAPLEQQIGQMANQMTRGQVTAGQPGSGSSGVAAKSGSAGQQQANSTFKAALGNNSEWRGDRPPAAWPTFPPDHPLAKLAQKRTTAQAMALAKDIEDRWEQSKAGNAKARPSSDEIQEACRALLAIDPKDTEFRKAWAMFVRLQDINRDAAS